MTLLRSYVSGTWHTAGDEGRPLHDAVTGVEIARISAAGVDVAAALDHGRRVGGPVLRELTFHQRAALLKALAGHLREHRDELYALSARTGATLGDSKFDVDGGIGVLQAYASKGRRELPDGTVHVDGAVEPLSRGGTFVGQHVCTSMRGVAVQVNAFNFPVWGPLEKLAPAFLAGMPTLVKPASPTAFLTARLVELIVGSGLLPEGTLQFLAGGGRVVAGLLDHLTEQDTVSFTGSAATAATLRTHPVIVERGVRFTAEADSLNLSILGPDAGAAEIDLYVRQLVSEMTVKAGQKCTAIRRAFVPAPHVDAVVEAVSARLARTTVGNPSNPEVRMGALAGLDQRADVRRGVAALSGAGRVVFGDPGKVEVLDADAERGAFLSPILVVADPDRGEPHTVEAFGPVSTVMAYTSTEQVIEYAARGRGSLAGSVVTADPGFARDVVLGVAPWHGRLLVLNERDAAESTGHGSPLPALVHGGPGRAGGGEELGGIRGVLHHMQRTAVQADPDTLTAITGRWVRGSRRRPTDTHPFRKHLDELSVGDTIVAGPRAITQEDVEHFAEFTGDTFYAHMDQQAAEASPIFGQRVAHGYLTLAFAAGLFVDPDPGPVLANYGLDDLRYLTPVRFGDEITVTLTCKQVTRHGSAPQGDVRWDVDVTRQDGESVARYDLLTLVATR
ncbi:MAG: phenylacetic acid degradation bifunctional protein PaaZ [Pseudonocardia sp.]